MNPDWKAPYHAAIREQDPAKLPSLCGEARRAINDRILQLGSQSADTLERRELEEALRRLVAHEAKKNPPPPESAPVQ